MKRCTVLNKTGQKQKLNKLVVAFLRETDTPKLISLKEEMTAVLFECPFAKRDFEQIQKAIHAWSAELDKYIARNEAVGRNYIKLSLLGLNTLIDISQLPHSL